MTQKSRAILAAITAIAVFVMAVNCACAGSFGRSQPVVRACCAAKLPRGPHRQNPGVPCPHCQGGAVQVTASGPTQIPQVDFVAPAFIEPVALLFYKPVLPFIAWGRGGASSSANPPTLLALSCAFLT